jgi:hypothetical protein
VAFAPSFTQFDIAVIDITNLSNGSAAFLQNQPNLTRRQAYMGVFTLFRQ